jgi:Leucine-rich repeat (LRR) protein
LVFVSRNHNQAISHDQYLSNFVLYSIEIDCSQYADDDHIIRSFPFTVHTDPAIQNSDTNFASMNNNRNVVSIQIVNQTFVPPLIYCFKHLSKLEIVNTSFCDSQHQLPVEIEHFSSSLTELRISNTKITHLPEQIGKLKRLDTLELSNTGLMSLPNSIANLFSLKFLLLPNNNLTSLPMTMTNLRSLQRLTLSNNPNLRSVQPLNNHPSLRILDTRHCPIELIPHRLPQLTTLYMSNNNLTKLTGIETLGQATKNKKSFDFDRNHLESVSSQIHHVPNLYRLDLDYNLLNNLPRYMFKITTLSYLNIQHNRFPSRDLISMVSKFRASNPNLTILHD